MEKPVALRAKRKRPMSRARAISIALLTTVASLAGMIQNRGSKMFNFIVLLFYFFLGLFFLVFSVFDYKPRGLTYDADLALHRGGLEFFYEDGTRRLIPWRYFDRIIFRHKQLSCSFFSRLPGRKIVCWTYTDNYRELDFDKKSDRLFEGYHEKLTDDYNIDPKEVAALMNRFKRQYGTRT